MGLAASIQIDGWVPMSDVKRGQNLEAEAEAKNDDYEKVPNND